MKRKTTFFSASAAALLFCGACVSVDPFKTEVPGGRTFRNFSGVCHGWPDGGPLWKECIGWNRFDIGWNNIQPKPGVWEANRLKKLEEKILNAKNAGVTFLPILDYGSGWTAAGIPDRKFEFCGRTYTVKRRPDGDFDVSSCNRQRINGRLEDVLIEKRKVGAKRMSQRFVPDGQVKDWEAYVRRIVSLLRNKPYELEYFQIWNEAHPMSSFWYGDMDTYMKNVHFPAAKIIHELGGKVVYGGWICGASIRDFVKYLDRHNAWDTIDVFDLHYFPIAGMEYLSRALKERGYADKGIWQTELGFTANPNFVGNVYPRVIHWGLRNNWNWADKYKLFYFAYGTPDDPKAYGFKRGFMLGREVNLSGRSLRTLAGLLGGAPIELYAPVKSVPALKAEINELASSLESFKIGRRIVSAAHLLSNNNAKIFVDWNNDLDTVHLDYEEPLLRLEYPEIAPADVEKIERVSMYGSRMDITNRLEKRSGGGIGIMVPVREPDRREFNYTDMPENFLPEVFYTVITLKK